MKRRLASWVAVSAFLAAVTGGIGEAYAGSIRSNFTEDSGRPEQTFASSGSVNTALTNTAVAMNTAPIVSNINYSSVTPTVLNSGGRYANAFHSADSEVAGLGARSERRRHRSSGISTSIQTGAIISTDVPDSGSTLLLLSCAFGALFGAKKFLPRRLG